MSTILFSQMFKFIPDFRLVMDTGRIYEQDGSFLGFFHNGNKSRADPGAEGEENGIDKEGNSNFRVISGQNSCIATEWSLLGLVIFTCFSYWH